MNPIFWANWPLEAVAASFSGGGKAAESHHQPDLEGGRELGDGIGERPPVHVRFGTGKHRNARAESVGPDAEDHLRPFDPVVDAIDDLELRPAGTLVEQLLGVEHRVRPSLDGLEQARHGSPTGETGIDPSIERDYEHRGGRSRLAGEPVEGRWDSH
jgi:hypothetical protein